MTHTIKNSSPYLAPLRIGTALNVKKTVAFLAFAGMTCLSDHIFAAPCRVAATMCEVQKAIDEAKLAPTPSEPSGTTMSVIVTMQVTFQPNKSSGATSYSVIGMQPRIYAYMSNNTNSLANISCTPSASFFLYQGTALNNAVSTAVTPSPAPGTTAVTVAVCTDPGPCTGTLDATNFNTTMVLNRTATGTTRVYDAYLNGFYDCTYADPNTSNTVHILAAIPQTT